MTEARAGRPHRSDIQKLISKARVLFWYQAVSEKSGWKSVSELERIFSAGSDGQGSARKLTGIWGKYSRGESEPSRKRDGKDLIDKVEKIYPGTKQYFQHPIWLTLEPRAFNAQELKCQCAKLNSQISSIFISKDESGPFWKKPQMYRKALDMLVRLLAFDDQATHSFDALAATIIDMRSAEAAQDQARHFAACYTALEIYDSLWANANKAGNIGLMQVLNTIGRVLIMQSEQIHYFEDEMDKLQRTWIELCNIILQANEIRVMGELNDLATSRKPYKLTDYEKRVLKNTREYHGKPLMYRVNNRSGVTIVQFLKLNRNTYPADA